MNKGMRINPKPSALIFINGAVIRADRKLSLELLSDLMCGRRRRRRSLSAGSISSRRQC
jgi:flagellar biosynthesis regulator FlbT